MIVRKLGRTDDTPLPDAWYAGIEKAKEKARKFVKQVIAIDQNSSVVVGMLVSADLDTLWQLRYPYCKLTISKSLRYRLDGSHTKMGELEVIFVNKPQMILTMQELAQRFPKIYEDVLGKIKTGVLVGKN